MAISRYFTDLSDSSAKASVSAVRRAVDAMRVKVNTRLKQASRNGNNPSSKALRGALDLDGLVRNFSLPRGTLPPPTRTIDKVLGSASSKISRSLRALDALPMASALLNGTRQFE